MINGWKKLRSKYNKRKFSKFVYPNGWWDGWDKFFIPACSKTVGDKIISLCKEISEHDNHLVENIDALLLILNNPIIKDVWRTEKGKPHIIIGNAVCIPTEEASKLTEILLELKKHYI